MKRLLEQLLTLIGFGPSTGSGWRFVGTFRDWQADWVECQVEILSYQVAVACETPETAEMERQAAIETFRRLGRYHGWISSPNAEPTDR